MRLGLPVRSLYGWSQSTMRRVIVRALCLIAGAAVIAACSSNPAPTPAASSVAPVEAATHRTLISNRVRAIAADA